MLRLWGCPVFFMRHLLNLEIKPFGTELSKSCDEFNCTVCAMIFVGWSIICFTILIKMRLCSAKLNKCEAWAFANIWFELEAMAEDHIGNCIVCYHNIFISRSFITDTIIFGLIAFVHQGPTKQSVKKHKCKFNKFIVEVYIESIGQL